MNYTFSHKGVDIFSERGGQKRKRSQMGGEKWKIPTFSKLFT